MNILISNDDGVFAPGIQALAKALSEIANVTVVAPESERSGFSSALTLDRPLRAVEISPQVWAVNGTPADCVYLSMNGLLEHIQSEHSDGQQFDLVVSGINSGPNLGDDVLYSGTVGAAFEGRLMKQPAIAVSFAGPNVRSYEHPDDYAKAANWVKDFIANGLPSLPPRHILNINIPDVDDYAGVQITHLGRRSQSKPITSHVDPRGRQVYWIGLSGEAIVEPSQNAAGVQSDFYAITHGYISITPIQMDSTNYAVLDEMSEWLRGNETTASQD